MTTLLSLLLFPLLSQASPEASRREGSWHLIDGESDPFSGFVVQGRSGPEIITAHHGPTLSSGCAPRAFDPKVRARRPASGDLKWRPLPFRLSGSGDCHYGHDAVKMPMRDPSPFCLVIPAQSSLRFKEPVVIAGFPDGRFRSHECILAGVRPSLNANGLAHFVLHCPGLSYDIGGMSGGPVIAPEHGLIIGFVNAQGEPGGAGYQRVYVTPLVRTAAGGIEFGLRRRLQAVDCFGSNGKPRGLCGVDEAGRLLR